MTIPTSSESKNPASAVDIAISERAQRMGRLSTWRQQGKIGWILLWLIGIPVPILLLLYLLRGCT